MARLTIALWILLAATPQPAYAYIDPGLGSLIFQSAVAGLLAVGVAWAGLKLKITSFFAPRKDTPDETKDTPDETKDTPNDKT